MKIVVTGGFGFLGQHVVTRLSAAGHDVTPVSRRSGHDLRFPDRVLSALSKKPDIAIHLAARLGGGESARKEPALLFGENLQMGFHLIEIAAAVKTRLFIVGTASSYPKDAIIPFREECFWDGVPASDDQPYGIAKKTLLAMAQAYRKEHGLKFGYFVLPNLYGPDAPSHGPRARIVSNLIRRIEEAKDLEAPEVVCRGTPWVVRSFLYVKDAADALARACEVDFDESGPINLPGTEAVSLERLALMIGRILGYAGKLQWSESLFTGQTHRSLDGTKAKKILNWEPKTDLEEGLRKTIEWYWSIEIPNS